MTAYCASKGIQQRHSAPYSQWMDHTAERTMRTLGEMAVTTMIHANMPKRAWGWAMLLACDVLNRTTESVASNKKAGRELNATRLERWDGIRLPGQTKALYPFGCLCFKHIPPALRTKLEAHATPCVYLGIDPASRSYLLGSLYDLNTSVAVEVTFLENTFPFRKFKASDSPASLLWGTDATLTRGDPRLGMFDTSSDETIKLLDRPTLKSIGALPGPEPTESVTTTPSMETPVAAAVADVPEPEATDPPLRRSTRVIVPPIRTNQRDRGRDPTVMTTTSHDSAGPCSSLFSPRLLYKLLHHATPTKP